MSRLLLCINLASAAFVQAQTLHRIVPTDTPPISGLFEFELASTTVSAIGVGEDGMTTYVEQELVSAFAYSQSGSIVSVQLASFTQTATFIEDASRILDGASTGEDIRATCTFNADGKGACVEIVPDITTTFTATVSGLAEPWITLDAAVAAVSTTTPPIPTCVVLGIGAVCLEETTAASSKYSPTASQAASTSANSARSTAPLSICLVTIAGVPPTLLFFLSL